MRKIKTALLSLLAIAIVLSSLSFNISSVDAAAKKTVAAPIEKNWITSGKYQYRLTEEGILNCKYKKKTRDVASRVVSAFVYGNDVVYKTDAAIRVYEGKIDTSYNITMKYAEGVSTTVPINDIILAGFGKGIIYYTAPTNGGQRLLFAFDYKAGTVDFVADYGYINKVYCVDNYAFILTNTSADSSSTGCLCRVDVTTGKVKVLSNSAISASFDNKKVYWAEPAADYTYTLGIGSLKIKSCGISENKEKNVVTLDDIDTYKTVVCMPKFVTCTGKTGVTFKYTYKNKKKTAYEAYQQNDLLAQTNVLN